MADPLLTGQQTMQRLEQEHPGLYLGSLRTLQSRMGQWRISHAEQVVGMADEGNPGPREQPAQQQEAIAD
jgi:hypothetical protein